MVPIVKYCNYVRCKLIISIGLSRHEFEGCEQFKVTGRRSNLIPKKNRARENKKGICGKTG
jgi:hypothetical protein